MRGRRWGGEFFLFFLFFSRYWDSCLCRGVESGNAQFVKDVTAWTFQESLVLRVDKTEHHLVNGTESLEQYTTNDNIVRFLPSLPACLWLTFCTGFFRLHFKI